jgi:hypothetical protein
MAVDVPQIKHRKKKKLTKKQRRHLFSRWRMDVPKGTGWLESM